MARIILTAGTSWTVPADWNNAANLIEALAGGGGSGTGEGTGGSVRAGGGTAYAAEPNVTLTPGTTVEIKIGVGGRVGFVTPSATYIKNNAGTKVVEAAPAANGGGGTGAGGKAADSIGSIKFDGGDGGVGGTRSGPGGGGAAGPNGPGKNGGNGLGGMPAGGGGGGGANGGGAGATPTNATGANGGTNRAGAGAGVGSASGPGGVGTDGGGGAGGGMDTGTNVGGTGAPGSVDPVWGVGYGPSSGGGGGAGNNTPGVKAGDGGVPGYGAGAGAGGAATGGTGTNGTGQEGGQGLLVITYTPTGDTTKPTMTGSVIASAIASTSYTISGWGATDNVGVVGYELSLDAGASYAPIGNVVTYNVVGRTPAATDHVRVRALDAAGNKADPLSAAITLAAAAVGTLNLQAVGLEFSSRAGQAIDSFAKDVGSIYRYTVHANGLVMGPALYTSPDQTTDANARLPNVSNAAFAQGATYRIHAIRQADGEAISFRVVAQ